MGKDTHKWTDEQCIAIRAMYRNNDAATYNARILLTRWEEILDKNHAAMYRSEGTTQDANGHVAKIL